MKKCKRCDIEKENIEFSLSRNSKDGLNSWCKKCKSEYNKEKLKERKIKKNGYKKCTKCSEEKHVKFFNIGNSKDGLNNWCKECNKNYGDTYYLENKERLKPIRKKWMVKNKNKFKEYLAKRYIELDKERLRKYYEENKNIIKDKRYKYKETETYKKWIKEYRIKNSWKDRYRYTLRSTINRIGKKKEDNTINILGYSSKEFKKHIESLFTEDMCWENRESFHIDHIIPVSAFKEETPINIVNSLDNLRPLSIQENLEKNNSIDFNEIEIYIKYLDYLKIDYLNDIINYLSKLEYLK